MKLMLLSPPGAGYEINGPHIALYLLAAYVRRLEHDVKVIDLNIKVARYYGVHMDKQVHVDFSSLSDMNANYYPQEEELNDIGLRHGGIWQIHRGFRFTGYNHKSSDSIREYSYHKSPYHGYYDEELLPEIAEYNPDVIGLGVVQNNQLLGAFELIRMLRSSGYQGLILLGGNIFPRIRSYLRKPWVFDLVDAVMLWPGEKSLAAILENLGRSKAPFDGVPNVIYRLKEDWVENPTQLINETDFVEPDFSDVDPDDYWGPTYYPLIGARGCYYARCHFCKIHYSWGPRGFLGYNRNVDCTLDTMRRASAHHGIANFKFIDESLHPQFANTLADLLLRTELPCTYEAYLRLDPWWLGKERLKRLADSGLKKVYIGLELESENKHLLGKRNDHPTQEFLKALSDSGILVHLFVIAGYPGTGEEDLFRTCDFCFENEDRIDTVDVSPFYHPVNAVIKGVEPVRNNQEDWALTVDYKSVSSNSLSRERATILADEVNSYLWQLKPRWLHPLYRMFSPWQLG